MTSNTRAGGADELPEAERTMIADIEDAFGTMPAAARHRLRGTRNVTGPTYRARHAKPVPACRDRDAAGLPAKVTGR